MDKQSVAPGVREVRPGHLRNTANSRVAELASAVKRRTRAVWDGVLHRGRRSAALDGLARAMPIQSVLFLCHGNICRSSYAELAFRRLTQGCGFPLSITSAGFVYPHRPPPTVAVEVARRRGLDMSAHRSRLLTQAMLDASDLVVVMDAAQSSAIRRRIRSAFVLVLGDLDPGPIDNRTIRDPWNADARVFESSYLRIDRCLVVLREFIAAKRAAERR